MSETDIPFRPMVLEEFAPLVGRAFKADTEPNSIELTLVEASPLRNHAMVERPPFILIFHSPPAVMLLDGIYALRCGRWGPDNVSLGSCLAPLNGEPGYYYQAVFN